MKTELNVNVIKQRIRYWKRVPDPLCKLNKGGWIATFASLIPTGQILESHLLPCVPKKPKFSQW